MRTFAEVDHQIWIDAPAVTVRSQFGDLDHHIRNNVHPKLRFTRLETRAGRMRFAQEVRLLGIVQRDVFEREFLPDGSICDTSVEGFNKDGSVRIRFSEAQQQGRAGTTVSILVRLPLPGMLAWLAPVLRAQVRREVSAAALEDKFDLEQRGYQGVAA